MIWGGIWTSGNTPLGFVEEGVKINQKVYQRDLLEAVALPWAQKHLGNANWTFQQDSALAHKAKKKTREITEHGHRVCSKPHKALDSLRQSLLREWDRLKRKDEPHC
ncbi:uncharacterized protein TNCV_3264291 [Trichonephila clavipes]|nr:uncharacterized protein TNCV_3264291 [Trichonephila clavipes]